MKETRPQVPKFLVSPWGEDHRPPGLLYAVRTRGPFMVASLALAEDSPPRLTRWPAVFPDASPARLMECTGQLLGILADEMDFYSPPDFFGPGQPPAEMEEPPPFLHLVRYEDGPEYVLATGGPRLYKVHTNRAGDATGLHWLAGWGEDFADAAAAGCECQAAAEFIRGHFGPPAPPAVAELDDDGDEPDEWDEDDD